MVAAGRGRMGSAQALLFGWVAGSVGIAAAARYSPGGAGQTPPPAPATTQGTPPRPAGKLDETRIEPRPRRLPRARDCRGGPARDADERRARVHAKAEAAIAEMQEPPA